jgi:DNA-binding transcriptional ArsR family regulator
METIPTLRKDAVLNPRRMKIIRALANGARTTKELLGTLDAIPQATLYRHVGILLKAGIIDVVAERPVRGVIERSYALAPGKAVLNADDLAGVSAEDHFRYFSMFAAGLLGEFSRYLERDHIDLHADGVGYREAVFNLSDREFRDMVAGLQAVLRPLLANKPSKRRKARLLATVLMPYDAPVQLGKVPDDDQ